MKLTELLPALQKDIKRLERNIDYLEKKLTESNLRYYKLRDKLVENRIIDGVIIESNGGAERERRVYAISLDGLLHFLNIQQDVMSVGGPIKSFRSNEPQSADINGKKRGGGK